MITTSGTPLTDAQRQAVTETRKLFSQFKPSMGKAPSFEGRSSIPPQGIPTDLSLRVEIAPPCSTPLPSDLLGGCALKTAERVPVFFFTFKSENTSTTTPADTKVILHIHGGANVVGSPTDVPFMQYYAEMLRAAAAQSGDPQKCILISPSYRLATILENAYPAALQDLVAAYDYVLSRGYDPANILLTGDSAGGNHAIVVPYLLSQTDRPLPSGIIALAPASIQVYDRMSEYAKAQANCDVLTISDEVTDAYVGDSGVSPTHPVISGAYITFPQSWPRTLILVGTSDQLIDASRELEKRLSDAECSVELVEYVGRPHGWWILPDIFPEQIQDSTQRIAQFLLNAAPE